MITIVPERTPALIETLTRLWEKSVQASHHFLSESDIHRLIPYVKDNLSQTETLVISTADNRISAFMGVENKKIEMLFVSPEFFGHGIGTALIAFALNNLHVKYVDVNEQNDMAAAFYRNKGFTVIGRDETDEQGLPFPILHLQYTPYTFRVATVDDIPEIDKLFRETVLTVNRRDYTEEEVKDWASCSTPEHLEELISNLYFIVALDADKRIMGIASLRNDGYLHSMFVHKDFQRRNIATFLLNEIERYARLLGIDNITSEVSLTARPFFERKGYQVKSAQKQKANKLYMSNFLMEKHLS